MKFTHIVALISLLMILPLGCKKKPEIQQQVIRPVKAIQVSRDGEIDDRRWPGTAAATQEADLAFRVPGTLAKFPVNVGDEIPQGTLLARLDPRDFKVALDNATGQLAKATAALDLAKKEYERVLRIRKTDPGAISQATFDARLGELQSARSQVASLQAGVSAARDALDDTQLTAPFSGTVVKKFVENYEDVQAKQPVVRLIDTSRIEFTLQIPEKFIGLIPAVTEVSVRFDAYPEVVIPSRVKEIGKEALRSTRTYPVTLIMKPPEGIEILPGMSGQAWIAALSPTANIPDSGVKLPITAVFSDNGSTLIWIVDTKHQVVSLREVMPGKVTNEGVYVKGLAPGEWVVTAGAHSLVEGQRITILN